MQKMLYSPLQRRERVHSLAAEPVRTFNPCSYPVDWLLPYFRVSTSNEIPLKYPSVISRPITAVGVLFPDLHTVHCTVLTFHCVFLLTPHLSIYYVYYII